MQLSKNVGELNTKIFKLDDKLQNGYDTGLTFYALILYYHLCNKVSHRNATKKVLSFTSSINSIIIIANVTIVLIFKFRLAKGGVLLQLHMLQLTKYDCWRASSCLEIQFEFNEICMGRCPE